MNRHYLIALAVLAAGLSGPAAASAQGRRDDYARAQQFLAEDLKISDNAPGLSTPGVKDFAEMR